MNEAVNSAANPRNAADLLVVGERESGRLAQPQVFPAS
jgi:hypothetical protein